MTAAAGNDAPRPAPARRALDFRSLDDVLADVERLRAGGYERLGRWDLATTCDHLAKGFEVALDRRPLPLPLAFRLLAPVVGGWVFRRLLRTRRMPRGLRAPAPFVP